MTTAAIRVWKRRTLVQSKLTSSGRRSGRLACHLILRRHKRFITAGINSVGSTRSLLMNRHTRLSADLAAPRSAWAISRAMPINDNRMAESAAATKMLNVLA